MHKPLYIIAACCAASFTSFAQSEGNEVFIKQLDGPNQASVEQGGGPGLTLNNTAEIFQKGSNNEADIVQGNNEFSAGVEGQVRDNTATVRQVGESNLTRVSQSVEKGIIQNNVVDILQQGQGNEALVRQETRGQDVSRNGVAKLTQQGNGNDGVIFQGNAGDAGSLAILTQQGNGNDGIITQSDGEATSNQATLVQRGDNNQASIINAAYGSFTQDNTATITQQGDGNDAEVSQGVFGSSEASTGTITQRGDDNKADIFQGESSSSGGTSTENAIGTILQQGESNEAAIFQGTNFAYLRTPDETPTAVYFEGTNAAINSEATIDQRGDNHYAAAIQVGSGDIIDIQQRGSGSYTIVAQGVAIPR